MRILLREGSIVAVGYDELLGVIEERTSLHSVVESLLVGKIEYVGAGAHTLESVLGIIPFK